MALSVQIGVTEQYSPIALLQGAGKSVHFVPLSPLG
jgi:hypothetical protein